MKILVSACLLGENCKYSGGNNYDQAVCDFVRGHQVVSVCPEVLGGLPTPRCPAEIVQGVVTNKEGIRVDREFRAGAEKALAIAKENGVKLAVLQSRSPSCGVKEIYDGTFSGTKIPGQGVFARMLMDEGIRVLDAGDVPEKQRGTCKMKIRKAAAEDIDAVERLYDAIHTAEENGKQTIGWVRGIYPVRKTAEAALARGDLFVLEDAGKIRGAGILNKIQVDSYAGGSWEHTVPDEQVCVLHTLVIDPDSAGKGYGRAFIEYYEAYARGNGCTELRIDTNARNAVARAMYKRHGYTEVGIVPTMFNGIEGVQLVLLEKYLGE